MSKDIFLGVGGSASSRIFSHYLFDRSGWSNTATTNLQRQAILVMSGVDSGGSTGMQNDLFNLENGLVNLALHQKADFPFQSYGDLKKFLVQALHFRQPEIDWDWFLDFRSYELTPQVEVFTQFSQIKELPTAIVQEFIEYLENFFFYYQKYYVQLPSDRRKPACLGNLLLSFLHSRCQDINQLNELLRQLELIPEWVEFVFLSLKHTHLEGLDIQEQLVQGEHRFDYWPKPIQPNTHKILNFGSSELIINPILLSHLGNLTTTDLIILSPGSDSNWLGLFNQPLIVNLLKPKTIFWLTNLFRFTSECPLPQTIQHLLNLGLKIELFLPEVNFIEVLFAPENYSKLASYIVKEHKFPHLIYLQAYEAAIQSKLEQWSTNHNLADLANQIKTEIAEYGVSNLEHYPITTHYIAKIENVNTSYYHDPLWANQWLLNYCYVRQVN